MRGKADRVTRHHVPSTGKAAAAICGAVLWAGAGHAATEEAPWSVDARPNPIQGGRVAIAQASVEELQLAVRCETARGLVEVRLFGPEPLITTTERVLWQVDDNDPLIQSWRRSPNGRSLVVPIRLQNAFVAGLRAGHRLVLILEAGDGGSRTYSMSLQGSSRAIAEATAGCRDAGSG